MLNYELVAGDGGSTLHVTILDSVTKEPVDLTGKTVKVRYSFNGAATAVKDMALLDQVSRKGQAEYRFLVADFTVGGTITGEVRLQHGTVDQLTTVDSFHLAVKAPLPEPA